MRLPDWEQFAMSDRGKTKRDSVSRRGFLKTAGAAAGVLALASCDQRARDVFFRKHYKELNAEEKKQMLARIEDHYRDARGWDISVNDAPPLDDVVFGYALDLSLCVGCRQCVYACVEENNLSRKPQVHYIQVLEMERERGIDLEQANLYYSPSTVPREGFTYMPVACQQCKNPPCVRACPTRATWQEPDGITVVDYDWCIGCRYCMAACPYNARKFNWSEPAIPDKELNRDAHYLGNRPRYNGVVEKCTFCINRVRKGRYPACVEICPVGARKFGNLLDPKSEIRYAIEHKRVFVLREALNTQPKFFYYYSV